MSSCRMKAKLSCPCVKALLGGTQQQFSQQNGENREAIEAIAESQGKLLDSTTQFPLR